MTPFFSYDNKLLPVYLLIDCYKPNFIWYETNYFKCILIQDVITSSLCNIFNNSLKIGEPKCSLVHIHPAALSTRASISEAIRTGFPRVSFCRFYFGRGSRSRPVVVAYRKNIRVGDSNTPAEFTRCSFAIHLTLTDQSQPWTRRECFRTYNNTMISNI